MCWRRRRTDHVLAEQAALASIPVADIRVSDDGFSLVGARYVGYMNEVTRRQTMSLPQDPVTVWFTRLDRRFVIGTPRVNNGGLEILENGRVLGVIRTIDGQLRYFPA